MTQRDEQERQIASLREGLSRLSEASLRINENLDVEEVLHAVMEGACPVTRAPYSLITTLDGSGRVEDHRVLGITPEDAVQLWHTPEGLRFFESLNALSVPLKVGNLHDFTGSIELVDFRSPVRPTAFMAAPILRHGVRVGNIFVGSDEPGREFTREDEEILVMFAAQVALVIANARRHRDEQRARADLETLINTSPVGVAVFDVATGWWMGCSTRTRRRSNCCA